LRILWLFVLSLIIFSDTVLAEPLKDFIRSYVETAFPDYKVLRVSAPNFNVDNTSSLKISLESSDRYYLRFKVTGIFNGERETLPVSVRVARLKTVVVAARDILPGELITGKMLNTAKIPEFKAGNSFSAVDEVVGKRAKRLIKAGKIIKFIDVVPDYKVFKNTPVKVIYESGVIRIEMTGVALQNGAVGDIIEVKNISTGKKILCKVVGNGVVKFIH